ncbi:MAG: BrnT family toxin [Chromatiales bacterium]
MSTPLVYHFDWDPVKARLNVANHGVTFQLATTVLRDPLALTVYDEDHSETAERWVTLGVAENGQYLVVVHTWQEMSPTEFAVRIISARAAEREEIRNYQEQPH